MNTTKRTTGPARTTWTLRRDADLPMEAAIVLATAVLVAILSALGLLLGAIS